jgi:DNA-binding transcriptional ArsR family regulator
MVLAERRGTVMLYTLGDRRLIEALDLLRAVMRDALARRAALLRKTA